MDEPQFHESNGLLKPSNNNTDRSVSNISDDSTKKMDDWKVTLISGSCACAVVFAVNLSVTIWSSVSLESGRDGVKTSRRIVYEGSCSKTRNMSLLIHLIINVLGSVLLSASNYGMQCLSTPTRADVDKAHAQKRWVDIGIPSFRNLREVSTRRVILWWLLVLSSLPLHLLLNSVVYSSLATYSYSIFTVDKNLELLERYHVHVPAHNGTIKLFDSRKIILSQLNNLTALECINQYGTTFQTESIDVILVVDASPSEFESNRTHKIDSAFSNNVRRKSCYPSDYQWICGKSCSPCHFELPRIKLQSDNWSPFGSRVEYCLSEPAPEKCRLNFDIYLAGIVLAVNLIKAVILALIVLRPPKEPMFVLGDAIQSFLAHPDENSRGSCLASARIVRDGLFGRPSIMYSQPKRRGVAVTKTRWFFSFVMFGVAFTVTCVLLVWGIREIYGPQNVKSLWSLGFGTANEVTLIKGNEGFSDQPQAGEQNIFPKVLTSNLPQLIFSLLYFQYNSLYTSMAAAKEWSDFGCNRRPLRVSSNPRGQQRSRYHRISTPTDWYACGCKL
ncbi:hypothetical protein FPOAC1_002544 [Fusarium poae]|uniref:hypothetical protein n=1 Tax=Fusarium poae TaxID=36050 RepID=UPI001CE84403|nr:hypothetical protein FPOAC1_002544 [Fusarium poae]KAG8676539.1 hypothetical protein FPOAC1_002544 [Fusarium poae]